MYHFPEQLMYHNNHNNNGYQQNSFAGPTKTQLDGVAKPTDKHNDQFEPAISIHVKTIEPADPVATKPEKDNKKRKKKPNDKSNVDTSNYSIEERLVAAVWVHERKRTRTSMRQIRQDFRHRFGREPPTKTTLMVWERKLFSTGSVCDAPRSGRPASSKTRSVEVVTCKPPTPRCAARRGRGAGAGAREGARGALINRSH